MVSFDAQGFPPSNPGFSGEKPNLDSCLIEGFLLEKKALKK
jgi:hypothetical protein